MGGALLLLVLASDSPKSLATPAQALERAVPVGLELLAPLAGPDGRFAPERISADPLGGLVALDRARGELHRWTEAGGWISFGTGEQGGPRTAHLTALEASWGTEVLALDAFGPTLHRFDLEGHFRGSVDLASALVGIDITTVDAVDATWSKSGEFYLLDRAGARLFLLDRDGRYETDLLASASGRERPEAPTRLVRDSEGDAYVLDGSRARVHRITRQGALLPPWSCTDGLRLGASLPGALAALSRGGLAIAARDGSWFRLFREDGELLYHGELGSLAGPEVGDLAGGPDDLLYLARPGSSDLARLRILYRDSAPPDSASPDTAAPDAAATDSAATHHAVDRRR